MGRRVEQGVVFRIQKSQYEYTAPKVHEYLRRRPANTRIGQPYIRPASARFGAWAVMWTRSAAGRRIRMGLDAPQMRLVGARVGRLVAAGGRDDASHASPKESRWRALPLVRGPRRECVARFAGWHRPASRRRRGATAGLCSPGRREAGAVVWPGGRTPAGCPGVHRPQSVDGQGQTLLSVTRC